MRLVRKMEVSPAVCLACGGNPVDVEGHAQPAVDLEVDINWGDNAYLCFECIHLIGDLIERPPRAKIEKIIEQNKTISRRMKQMAQELEEKDRILKRIKDGRKAIKEVKEADGG